MKKIQIILWLMVAISVEGQLKEKFDLEAYYQHLNGVILVSDEDSILFEGCYGTIDEKEKISTNTPFDIGSLTKQFTAAAILQLVSSDLIELKGSINEYLGRYASDRWKKITVHQLLNHTSGIPSLYQTEQGLDLFFPEKTPIELEKLITKFKDAKLLFSPGEEFNYNNSGYILLAAMIEEVSGLPYADYLKKNIFEKYDLKNTTFNHSDYFARPYYGYRRDMLEEAPIYDPAWYIGAGGVYSSANDLKKWIQIIQSEEFLTKELRVKYLSSRTNVGYGYGWQFSKNGRVEHDGGNDGSISFLSFDPRTKQSVIILTNRSYKGIHNLGKSSDIVRKWSEDIWSYLKGNEVDMLEKPVRTVQRSGNYQNETGEFVSIKTIDSVLELSSDNLAVSRLVPNTALNANTASELKMINIARYLQKKSFWKLAKYCDGEMKFISYSGIMSIGLRMIRKKVGKALSFTPYFVSDSYGLVRMHGTERILDLIIYFDGDGKVVGIFENEFFELEYPNSMIAYSLGNGRYYLDGIPYGEKSSELILNDNQLSFYQMDRKISLTSKK